MSHSCTGFRFMEAILEKIENKDESLMSGHPVRDERALADARQELEFKVQIGQSKVWTNILRLDEFLMKANA